MYVCMYVSMYVCIQTTDMVWGNIVTSQAAGPGSVPGQVNFLVEFFFGVFPQPYDKCQ